MSSTASKKSAAEHGKEVAVIVPGTGTIKIPVRLDVHVPGQGCLVGTGSTIVTIPRDMLAKMEGEVRVSMHGSYDFKVVTGPSFREPGGMKIRIKEVKPMSEMSSAKADDCVILSSVEVYF